MNLRTLMKAAKGAASLDEMLEMMSALGIHAEVAELTKDGAAEVNAAGLVPGAKMYQMKARLVGGQPLLALLILPPG